MVWKWIGLLLVFLLVTLSALTFQYYLPGEFRELRVAPGEFPAGKEAGSIDYGKTPVLYRNLRFDHNRISYSLEETCPAVNKEKMIEGFAELSNKINVISFYETEGEPDIQVSCSEEDIEIESNLFVAGEGGPTKIINASAFGIIKQGKILLYEEPRCDYPVVEIHELLHVLGFDHSTNPNNILFNVSRCDQRVTSDIVRLLDELYSIEALPDLSIEDLVASTKGRYLDFNVTVENIGLMDSSESSLTVSSGGKEIHKFDLGAIKAGAKGTLKAQNVKLFSSDSSSIEFTIDRENTIRELKEGNNLIRMIVSS
ncbi:hypothetical protein HOA55_03870 [archaeon]|jgi:hypothetical protein|nr:hypothetical protein [archaeon]MBT3577291.1 hypothetical protein [archaeon]MBT6820465.1 hypothetical protein [archaeon]MBT6956247.1 hypothetical protein [archaeon]MBT7025279.1 hypothetical protein [archaeon]